MTEWFVANRVNTALFAAVRAALSLPWSTGPVEGQISHLKTIKRTMSGRAGFDLLRTRMLEAA